MDSKCIFCGGELITADLNGVCGNCRTKASSCDIPFPNPYPDYNYYYQAGASQGWQCPVCQKVWSPWQPSCDCHLSGTGTYSTSTAGTSINDTFKEEK